MFIKLCTAIERMLRMDKEELQEIKDAFEVIKNLYDLGTPVKFDDDTMGYFEALIEQVQKTILYEKWLLQIDKLAQHLIDELVKEADQKVPEIKNNIFDEDRELRARLYVCGNIKARNNLNEIIRRFDYYRMRDTRLEREKNS